MNHRDITLNIECIICGQIFPIQVNSKDYEKFSNSNIEDIEMEQLFPHLNDEEINLIMTQICENCI